MALPVFCHKCQEITMHNSRGKCLTCYKNDKEQEFENWKSNKSIETQVRELYFMIQEKQDKSGLY